MSVYDNDPRLRRLPDGSVRVSDPQVDVDVVVEELDDDVFAAFETNGSAADAPYGGFDTVVHALIGDPW